MLLRMPVGWAVQGYGVPTVCVRHGRSQTRRGRIDIVSQAPGWTYAMLLLGGLPFIIARAVTKKTIVVKAWPFCDRCVRRRWTGAVATGLLVAAGIVTAIVGLALVDSQGDWAFWAAVGGILLMIVGLAATRWGQWAGVAKVVVDSELVWFKVRGPHPEFEKQVSYGPAGVMSPVS